MKTNGVPGSSNERWTNKIHIGRCGTAKHYYCTTTSSTSITINSMPVNCKNRVFYALCRPATMKTGYRNVFKTNFLRRKFFINISAQYWPIFDAIYFDIYTATLFVAVILFFVGFCFFFSWQLEYKQIESNIHIFFVAFGQYLDAHAGEKEINWSEWGTDLGGVGWMLEGIGYEMCGKQLACLCVVNTANYQSKIYVW